MSYCEIVSGSPLSATYKLRPSGATTTPHGPLPAGTEAFGVGTPVGDRSYTLTSAPPVA